MPFLSGSPLPAAVLSRVHEGCYLTAVVDGRLVGFFISTPPSTLSPVIFCVFFVGRRRRKQQAAIWSRPCPRQNHCRGQARPCCHWTGLFCTLRVPVPALFCQLFFVRSCTNLYVLFFFACARACVSFFFAGDGRPHATAHPPSCVLHSFPMLSSSASSSPWRLSPPPHILWSSSSPTEILTAIFSTIRLRRRADPWRYRLLWQRIFGCRAGLGGEADLQKLAPAEKEVRTQFLSSKASASPLCLNSRTFVGNQRRMLAKAPPRRASRVSVSWFLEFPRVGVGFALILGFSAAVFPSFCIYCGLLAWGLLSWIGFIRSIVCCVRSRS